MQVERTSTSRAPMAVGPYSQAVAAGDFVFTAGEIPVDPATGAVPRTVGEQTRLALSNLREVLRASGVGDGNVASVTVYLADIGDFQEMNLAYAEFFSEPYPARSCVAVSALPKGVRVMVSAVGVRGQADRPSG